MKHATRPKPRKRKPQRCYSLATAQIIIAEKARADALKLELAWLRARIADDVYALTEAKPC